MQNVRTFRSRDHPNFQHINLQDGPTLSTASFTVQFEELVAEPCRRKPLPPGDPLVVIIDALDECEPLLIYFEKEVPKLPSNIKFFLTSRPIYLVDRLLSSNFPIGMLGINILDDANKQDCSVYIRAQLRRARDAHPGLKGEFTKEDTMLVHGISEKAGGLFIWLSTVFRYVRFGQEAEGDARQAA
ncbi:uncharacterized protein EI90DRAFT_3121777 [Cantharellus anzutake]|uniref:uncharacterized protein n=1 Tax=Cantharellus anzutake TaxID=1750568 RepID=UPI0019047FA6|nr:uncharacterized protein EI90DRAFT_3121777 [Cantharellus anzutake]KAF8333470.1 hypothetical protein EI90DRAFT_3121777 [Cantharellus anzutake]